jgi:mono/diheme cytochrome c family protein
MKMIINNKRLVRDTKQHLLFYAILFGLLGLTACNPSSNGWPGPFNYATLPATGDAAAGKALFQAGTISVTACGSCHAVLSSGPGESGPSLTGVAQRAATGWDGHSAADYLFRAIVYPTAHVVSGYSGGVMPTYYGDKLQPQQIRDLIAYLLTL